jgi:acylphosphatase
MEKRRLVITGLVQGVSYRQALIGVARRLTLTGWVRNRRDGSVEAMIAGSAEAVAALIDWARRGPAGAEVEHVAVELGTGDHQGFEQLPTA